MTTTTIDTIAATVREALSRRDSRRDVLAARIREIAGPAMEAARVRQLDLGEAGRLEWRVALSAAGVEGDAQLTYVDDTLPRELYVQGQPLDVRSLGPVPARWDALTGDVLRPATVAQLRAVAAALPEALAQLLASRQDEAEALAAMADEALADLATL